MPEPEWQVIGNDFWTTFYFTESAEASHSGAESGAESLRDRIVAVLLELDLSKSEIASALDMNSVTGALNRTMRELLETEIIEYTIPDKPNSRLQKYRLTQKGKQLASTK